MTTVGGGAHTLSQPCFTTSWLAKNRGTRTADDNGVRMREYSGDGEAP